MKIISVQPTLGQPVGEINRLTGSLRSHPRALAAALLVAGVLAGCGGSDASVEDTQAVSSPTATDAATDDTPAEASTTVEDSVADIVPDTVAGAELSLAFEEEQHAFLVFSCATTPQDGLLVVGGSGPDGTRPGDAYIAVPAAFLVPGIYVLDRTSNAGDAADPDAGGVQVVIFFQDGSSYDEVGLEGWELTLNGDLSSGSFVALGAEAVGGDFSCA